MKKASILAVMSVMLLAMTGTAFATHSTAKGFDQYGYNYNAKLFVGAADGVDRNLDGRVWGDSTYANDHLVMKWSKAWDDARFHGAAWTPNAWVDNEWNGMNPDGTRSNWHYKIVWVGTALQNSQYWHEGGYPIWGEFEVLMDQGVDKNIDWCGANNGGHQICALAIPNGYGS